MRVQHPWHGTFLLWQGSVIEIIITLFSRNYRRATLTLIVCFVAVAFCFYNLTFEVRCAPYAP